MKLSIKLWMLLGSFFLISAQLWSLPVVISTPGQNASNPQCAIDINGNGVAVWIENNIIKSQSSTLAGGWSGVINTLSGSGASDPQVQIDLNGMATAIWVENGVIQASSQPLAGSWSAEVALSGSGASSPKLAIDPSGNLVAVWVEGDVIKSATLLIGGSWPVTPDTISDAGASSPQVAIGGGTVMAVWQGTIVSTPTVYAASKAVSGSWGAPTAISTASVNSSFPQIALDASGNATAIWYIYSQNGFVYSNVILQSSWLPSGGAWSSPVNLSDPGIRNPADLVSQVGVGPPGTAIAVWTTSHDGATFLTQSNLFSNGSWGTNDYTFANDLFAYDFDLAAVPLGYVGIAWMYYNPTSSSVSIQLTVADKVGQSAGDIFPLPFSPTGNNAYPDLSATSLGSTIFALLGWVNWNGTNNQIIASTLAYQVVQPPSNLMVVQNSTNYGVLTQFYNTLSWQASLSNTVVNYFVYRNGQFVAALNATALTYNDYNRPTHETVTYGVSSGGVYGGESTQVTTTFSN